MNILLVFESGDPVAVAAIMIPQSQYSAEYPQRNAIGLNRNNGLKNISIKTKTVLQSHKTCTRFIVKKYFTCFSKFETTDMMDF